MSVQEELNNWLKIQDLVKEDFLRVITHQEIVPLIKIFDVDVPGFSKRIDSAPFPILKNRFTDHLKQIPLNDFFKNYALDTYDELKDAKYEEGIKKIASNNKLKNTEVISLLAVLYPTKYKKHREEFIHYIDDSSNNLLANVIDLEIRDVLHSIINIHQSSSKKIYDSMNLSPIKKDVNSLQAYFKSDYKLESNAATTLFFTNKMKELEFTVEEKNLLLKLSIFELLKNHSKHMTELAKWKEDRQRKDKLYNNLMQKIENMKANEIKRNINVREKHEKEIKEKDKLINYFKNENKLISNQKLSDITKLKQEIESLQEQLSKEQKKVSNSILNESDQILLFTDRTHEYEETVEKGLLKELNQLEICLTKQNNEKLFFVDVFGMSTSNRREIRRVSKSTNQRIKLLNGTPINIIRNIIYYIEGVGLN